MPVRSLNTAVFKWPDREQVLSAAGRWGAALRARDADVVRIGCVGSYARGDWGVGSDLDVIVILRESNLTTLQRYSRYYPEGLPVPADVWVHTMAEWDALAVRSPQLRRRLEGEWLELAGPKK